MNQFVLRGVVSVLTCSFAGFAIAQTPPKPAPAAPAAQKAAPAPMTEEQKNLYALGVLLGRNLDSFALTPSEFNTVRQGFTDEFAHKAETKDAESRMQQVQVMQHDRWTKAGDAFAAKAAMAPGATKTPSGLIFIPVKAGTGANPVRTDRVKVNYEGRLIDGTVFDSSAQHGPVTFALTGVIPCWTEALQLMKVGGKSRIVCPAAIAYGDRPNQKIRPGSTLEFDVELLDIEPPLPPPAAAAPPTPSPTPADQPPK